MGGFPPHTRLTQLILEETNVDKFLSLKNTSLLKDEFFLKKDNKKALWKLKKHNIIKKAKRDKKNGRYFLWTAAGKFHVAEQVIKEELKKYGSVQR